LALAALLQVAAIHRQSLTYDAPYHLLAGYQALARGENLLNYEHPPLVKMAAALPLLAEPVAGGREPLVGLTPVTAAYPAAQFVFADPARERPIRLASRYTLLLLVVVPLLAAAYALGRRLAGPHPAAHRAGLLFALALGLSFATLPHLSTVQTDAALALAVVLTLLAGCAYLDRPDALRAAALGTALGLALAVKLSGVLLLPTVLAAIALAPAPSIRRRLLHLALALLLAAGLLESTYLVANRNYHPDRGREAIRAYLDDRATLHVAGRLEPFERPLLALEHASPGLAQYLTGLLGVRAQDAEGVYNAYAFGAVTARGRWWYFPAVFFLKTPLPLLLALILSLPSLFSSLRRPPHPRTAEEPSPGTPPPGASDPALNATNQTPPREPRGGSGGARPPSQASGSAPRSPGEAFPATAAVRTRSRALAVLTATIYLLAATTSTYNLGLRHLLPVLPLLYLPAAAWAARTRLRATLLTLLLAAESLTITPLWMSATNTWFLGAANPARFALGDTNLEYHQNFLALAAELERRGIDEIAVAMPALTPAELSCYLPNARIVTPGEAIAPGWYAVNVTVELVAPALLAADPDHLFRPETFQRAARDWSTLAGAIAEGDDHGVVAATFHLYRVP